MTPPPAPNELWRRVRDTDYEVSNLGHVRRNSTGKMLKLTLNPYGYPVVSISANGKAKSEGVHALVTSAFLGPRPEGHVVNHKDGAKQNNQIKNLEYVTPLDQLSKQFGARHKQETADGLKTPPPIHIWEPRP